MTERRMTEEDTIAANDFAKGQGRCSCSFAPCPHDEGADLMRMCLYEMKLLREAMDTTKVGDPTAFLHLQKLLALRTHQSKILRQSLENVEVAIFRELMTEDGDVADRFGEGAMQRLKAAAETAYEVLSNISDADLSRGFMTDGKSDRDVSEWQTRAEDAERKLAALQAKLDALQAEAGTSIEHYLAQATPGTWQPTMDGLHRASLRQGGITGPVILSHREDSDSRAIADVCVVAAGMRVLRALFVPADRVERGGE